MIKNQNERAENIYYFEIGNETIPVIYEDKDEQVSIIKNDGEIQKNNSNSQVLEVRGNTLYYKNSEYELSYYNIETVEGGIIAKDYKDFTIINENQQNYQSN